MNMAFKYLIDMLNDFCSNYELEIDENMQIEYSPTFVEATMDFDFSDEIHNICSKRFKTIEHGSSVTYEMKFKDKSCLQINVG